MALSRVELLEGCSQTTSLYLRYLANSRIVDALYYLRMAGRELQLTRSCNLEPDRVSHSYDLSRQAQTRDVQLPTEVMVTQCQNCSVASSGNRLGTSTVRTTKVFKVKEVFAYGELRLSCLGSLPPGQ